MFRISLKHNNRALAGVLSKEKENSRRITTGKMQLQKEAEKLNFENTFLRLKLNTLVWKLYCFGLSIKMESFNYITVETLKMFLKF